MIFSGKIFSIIVMFFSAAFLSAQEYSFVENENGKYLANTLVIKLKDFPAVFSKSTVTLSSALQRKLEFLSVQKISAVFPQKISVENSPLGKIIKIEYLSSMDPALAAKKIAGAYEIEWAEPKFVYDVGFVPNDPNYPAQQYNLVKIQAADAWDITQGDTSIVIGIVDTGIDWDHPDLSSNIWMNYDEIPDNGVDDDGNGYVDDIRGWDFSGTDGNSPDNNPMEDAPTHGTFVSGVASAVTNNSIGVASIGFKSKLMGVKTSMGNSRSIIFGYEGIVYAADNGAKIINCSWGGSGFSIMGKEVIDYALSKGSLVVSAAGNDNTNVPNFPASYNSVLNVAATDQGDIRASYSNYGPSIDVTAPGNGINSTWQNDTYSFGNGTSYSSPLAAGLAALVASHFPNFTPEQIGEQIRTNADDIYSQNSGFDKLLGKGRINAYKSLNNSNSVSVRITNIAFSDEAPGGNGDGIFQGGETIMVSLTFKNYLSPTGNLNIYLENKNSYSTIGNAIFNAGSIGTLESFNNNSAKFTFSLNSTIPENSDLLFSVNFIDGTYNDFQLISTVGNPTFATHAGNDVALTITSKGTLAYNDFPTNMQGQGFSYLNQDNLLFEGALMIATSSTKLVNGARGGSSSSGQDNDFAVVQPFTLQFPGPAADLQGLTIFNDGNAGGSMIGLSVKLSSYTYADPPNNNYIILRYGITNNSGEDISNLFAGLFFDWDILEGSGIDDYTAWDTTGSFGYVYHVGGNPDTWIGTALLAANNYNFWGINNAGGDGGFQIYDGFTDNEKWQTLSSGIGKPQAGAGDISHVISGGPYNILNGQTIDVGFAIAGGADHNEIGIAVTNARLKYQNILTDISEESKFQPGSFQLAQNYPNPFNPATTIKFQIPQPGFVNLKVYDVLGKEIAALVNGEKTKGEYEIEFNASGFSSGVYFYRIAVYSDKITSGNFSSVKKMILTK